MSNLGTWTGIKAGLKTLVATMTKANGYNYDWCQYNKKNIAQPEEIYVTVHAPEGEDNKDKDNFVGTGRFDNERLVKFYLYIENTDEEDLDDTIEAVKDLLELGLDDFNNKFNGSIEDVLCAQGVYSFDYNGFDWVEDPKADQYAPIKMMITYKLKYRKNRNIS